MKKLILHTLLVSVLTNVLFFSCKKYEDGPTFTLVSKKARVSGVWKLESIILGELDLTKEYKDYAGNNYNLTINKEGTYKQGGNINESGKWTFENNKEKIIFDPDKAGLESYSYKILRLTGKELWLQGENSSGRKSVLKYKQ